MVIASQEKNVWIFDVYYAVADDFKIYFVSRLKAKHSRQILKNPQVAFSVVWYDPKNLLARKAVQGKGICRQVKNDSEILKGVKLHNQYFPEFKSRLTVSYISSQDTPSKLWSIQPQYIKFWNDELYKEKESEEFFF